MGIRFSRSGLAYGISLESSSRETPYTNVSATNFRIPIQIGKSEKAKKRFEIKEGQSRINYLDKLQRVLNGSSIIKDVSS